MFSRKYRVHAALILAAVFIIYLTYTNNQPDQHKTEAAGSTATEFMQMVDAEKYLDSWMVAAPYLREKVDQEKWQQQLKTMRAGLGAVVVRRLEKSSFTAAIKEMPDSELLLLEYASQFENKDVREIVTVIHQKDSLWRVIGYRIQ